MDSERRPSAGEMLNRQRARFLLDRMERLEGLAEDWQEERVEQVRAGFAARYYRIVGVHPQKHSELKEALERVRDGGRMPVADILDVLNGEVR